MPSKAMPSGAAVTGQNPRRLALFLLLSFWVTSILYSWKKEKIWVEKLFDAQRLLEYAANERSVMKASSSRVTTETCPKFFGPVNVTHRAVLDPSVIPSPSLHYPKMEVHNFPFMPKNKNKDPFWEEACKAVHVNQFRFKDSETVVQGGGDGHAVLVLFRMRTRNMWHQMIDCPTFWCAAMIGEKLFPSKSSSVSSLIRLSSHLKPTQKYNATVVIFEYFYPNTWRTLLEGLYEEVLVYKPKKAQEIAEKLEGKQLFVWDKLDTSTPWYDFKRFASGSMMNGKGQPVHQLAKIVISRPFNPFMMRTMKRVLNGHGVRPREALKGSVLVIQRSGKFGLKGGRKLLSQTTGDLAGILTALCDRGLDVVATELKGVSLRHQLDYYQSSAVLIAAHGAAITNLIFMSPGSVVIEVTLRNRGESVPYISLCFIETAQEMGIYHFLHDPVVVLPLGMTKDRGRVSQVYVNETLLADEALGGLYLAHSTSTFYLHDEVQIF